MDIRPLVGIGFLLHTLLGPLCMAMTIDVPAGNPHAVEHHASSGHHESNEDASQNCAGHCLAQAKDIVVSDGPAIPVGHIIEPIDTWNVAFAIIENRNESPVSSPPFSLAAEKTVLLL